MQIEITPEYLASQGLSATFPERFWAKVKKTDGCWLWTAARLPKGYGQIGRRRKLPISAHKASWILHFGPIPKGLSVLHVCNTPGCVRPDHLVLGTQADNQRHMVLCGRSTKGEINPNSKLTDAQVLEIRRCYIRGKPRVIKGNSFELSKEFGVSQGSILRVARGELWKHVHSQTG